ELNMPPMDGAEWLALFQGGAVNEVSSNVLFPERITLRTPSLTFAGQSWNNVSLVSQPEAGGSKVEAQGREINASLTMRQNAPLAGRYSLPAITTRPPSQKSGETSDGASPLASKRLDFRGWPDLQLRCAECWLWGQNTGASTVISQLKAIP
ncbi:hypothetical protein UA70_18730, partial [Raoultella planticola]